MEEVIKELLKQFYRNMKQKPAKIIMFRDGVSEGQFQQVSKLSIQNRYSVRRKIVRSDPKDSLSSTSTTRGGEGRVTFLSQINLISYPSMLVLIYQ